MFALVAIKYLYTWLEQITIDNPIQFLLILMMLSTSFVIWWSILPKKLPYPPGPVGLPIFGSLLSVQKNFYTSINKISEKYGPICSVYLGDKLVVFLSHHRIIKDAFRMEEFTGRPHTEFTRILEGYGIVNTEGELWKEQRKFVHEKLRNFGARNSYNRNLLEKTIMREVNLLLNVVEAKAGQPYNLHHVIASSLSNVICSMLMDVRFDHQDPQFLRFLHLMDEGLRLFSVAAPASYVPGLRYVPGINWAYNQIVKNRNEMHAFIKKMVEEHKATRDPTKARDFVDEYLMEIDKQINNNQEDDGKKRRYFSEEQLYQVIGDLFSTGLEPVKDTLQWAILFMVSFPEIQTKVQEELDAVVGQDRLPTLNDQPFLPYTNATVLEILRSANVLGIGSSRRTLKDTQLHGYTIPKNAHVVPLIWAVHKDLSLWENPETFDPTRFIDKTGKVTKPDYFLPFSSGRRMCVGEVLAKTEIFLFLSSILHRFQLRPSESTANLERVMSLTQIPSHFQVSAILRNSPSAQLIDEDFD